MPKGLVSSNPTPPNPECHMATKKSSTRTSSTKARSGSSKKGSAKGNDSASSMVLQLIGSVVGDSLSESVSNLRDKVSEQVAVHGAEYLESARDRISEVTRDVVTWGKKHPVKTVAAAAALIAVSGFLYATLQGKAGQVAKKTKAKFKAAGAVG